MDSIHVHAVKAFKTHANQRHRQIRKITSLFRIIEICVVLILISRLSSQFSGEYFRDFSVVFFSPRFVFVIGNAIVITLFVKSGQFSSKDGDGKNSGTNLYEEFIEKSEKSQKIGREGIENQIKQSVFEDNRDLGSTHDSLDVKIYRRSQSSENLKRVKGKRSGHVLQRSMTEKMVEVSYPEDGMSNEEFRRTVEAFIERQQRLRREEEYSAFLL